MIQQINLSELDKTNLSNYVPKKNFELDNLDFTNLVVNKPWGYEYLMYESPEVSIWMLYIKKGFGTSMHCHPNKKTSLLVIKGKVISFTLNEKKELEEKDGRIFEKGVFHSTEAISEDGAFIMEIETPSNKTDLFRLKDKYNRESKAYTEKKNITKKVYNYHYLFLDKNKESTNEFGKYKILVRKFSTTEFFGKNIDKISSDIAIILTGKIKIKGRILEEADIINFEEFKKGEIISPCKILFLSERKNLIKLSDYVIKFLEKKGIRDTFLVSGGNLMHLLESLRKNKNMHYLCNHHEQASAMAAEGYAKMTNKVGFAMVTSGPGGTNAITGIAGAWMDSNPLLIISGQSYDSQTIGKTKLRQLGVQEINIVDIVRPITKYAIMVKDPKKIKYHLEKALFLATNGRPGPVLLDIPINIQMKMIEEETLPSFKEYKQNFKNKEKLKENVLEVLKLLQSSKRPIILLGNGVRLAKGEKEFIELAEKLSIPIVTSRNANDLMWEDHSLYVGRPGSFGQLAANLAIQNSDLVLSIGSRISLALIGWAYKDFAREAKKIVVDIDSAELKKPTIKPDLTIQSDAKEFILTMLKNIKNYEQKDFSGWKEKITHWKEKFPIILPEYKNASEMVNTYFFTDLLSKELLNEDVVITDMGMSFQCVMQALKLKKGTRLFSSSGLAAMGFGLPGAIGACIANNRRRVICITGDGGLQMNIQELQTIIHNKLPIKIFVFNNKGYTSIRETQKTYFKEYIAADNSSGVSIPDIIKIAHAYGIKTKKIENQKNLQEEIKEVLGEEGPIICDLKISESQQVLPKQGAFDRPDGKTVPRPIEDMIPYLERDLFHKEMIVEPIPFDPYRE